MDVHPPHEPIHSWRDFFIHIATITIGLLIALGLEAGVEAVHRRHERAETRRNLLNEITESRKQLPHNLRALEGEKQELQADIVLLRQLQAHQSLGPKASLRFNWYWSSMPNAAYQTARETGALALFPAEQVEGYDSVYDQQSLVDNAGLALSRSMTESLIPLRIQPDLAALSPSLLDEMIRHCAVNLNQIDYIQTLAADLPDGYTQALSTL